MTNTSSTNHPTNQPTGPALDADPMLTMDSIIDEALTRSVAPLLGVEPGHDDASGSEFGDYDADSRFGSARLDHLVDRLMLAFTSLALDEPDKDTGEHWNRILVALAFTDTYTARGEHLSHRGVPTITAWEGGDTFASPIEHVEEHLDEVTLDLLETLAAEREPAMVDWNLMTFFLTPETTSDGQQAIRTRVVPYREMNPVHLVCDATSMVHLLSGDLHLSR